MPSFRDRSIRQKISLMIMLITGAALLFACVALLTFQAWSIEKDFKGQLAVMASIVANDVAAGAKLDDQEQAAQLLARLKAMPQIFSASLKSNDGSRLAHFGTEEDEGAIKAAPISTGMRVEGHRVLLAQPLLRDGRRLGTLYLLADTRGVDAGQIELYSGVLAAVFAVSLLLAVILTSRIQGFVTTPMLRLAKTARRITEDKNYALLAEESGSDEVGVLARAFNRMLAHIQAQDTAFQGVQRELRERLKSLQREIAERKRAQAAQAQLTAIIDGTPDFVGTADPTGRVLYLNAAARRMIGLENRADNSAMTVSDLHPDWAARIVSTEGIPAAIHDGSWAAETAVRHRDGQEIHVSQVIIAHKNPTGGLEHISTVMRDVSERKAAEEALRLSQQKLVETSRLAGMAEVATGVLHNVGNVLNSVNVSAGLVLEKLRRSKAPKLSQAAALLAGRNGDLADYLTHDPTGQKLPGYLAKLGNFLAAENTQLLTEVEGLSRNIEHIKEVVAMQQSYAKVSGVYENLPLNQLAEDSIAMNAGAFERHGVTVERRFSDVPPVRVDRHRVLQVLINLIRNAKYALDDVKRMDKRITISITQTDETKVRIDVADNGIGISRENLARIFGHGFTTRSDGHGFGLHSGALAAKEMGGSLSVHSDGLGQGATFTLELPIALAASHP